MLCILKHVEDRSSTLKDSNTMYVEDGKRTYTHILGGLSLHLNHLIA